MKTTFTSLAYSVFILCSLPLYSNGATNNVQLPSPTPGNLQLVGRYSTVGQGIPSLNGSLSVQGGALQNGKTYLSLNQSCIGDVWPDNTPQAGQPVQGGVLVLDVNNVHNIVNNGVIPWVFTNPLTDPNFAFAFATSTTGFTESAKLRSRTLLAVEISGDNCIPRLGFAGQNGIELWDISNPDPTKAKLLSFIQMHDINPVLAAAKPNGNLAGNMHLFSQGNKDYLAVTINADLGTLQFFDITNPMNPVLAATWGPEQIQFPNINPVTASGAVLATLTDYTRGINPLPFGFNVTGTLLGRIGADVQISQNGQRAYLSGFDAGVILLDIKDLKNIQVISVAKNFDDAARANLLSSEELAVSTDEKTVIERAATIPIFTKFTINNMPTHYVPMGVAEFAPPIITLPGGTLATHNNLRYLGDACDASMIGNAVGNQVALIRRGTCSFQQKALNVIAHNYSAFIVINSSQFGETSVDMAGATPVSIPGVSIPYYDGLLVLNPSLIPNGYPIVRPGDPSYAPGLPFVYLGSVQLPTCRDPMDPNNSLCNSIAAQDITITSGYEKWSGYRIWDYSNKANPVLVSTLDTFCSNTPSDPNCHIPGASFGAFGALLDNGGRLYMPWSDELQIADITKPAMPKYVASFKDMSNAFVTQNGGYPLFEKIVRDVTTGCLFTTSSTGGLYIFADPTSSKLCGGK